MRPARSTDLSAPASTEGQQVYGRFVDGWANYTYKLWIMGAEDGRGGTRLSLRTHYQRNLACREHYLLVRGPGGYAGHAEIPGGPTVWGDCEYETTILAEGVRPGDEVQVEWHTLDTPLEDAKSGDAEPDDAVTFVPAEALGASTAPEHRDKSTLPGVGSVREATSSTIEAVVGPVLGWGSAALGLYVAWQSRESITNAAKSLLQSDG